MRKKLARQAERNGEAVDEEKEDPQLLQETLLTAFGRLWGTHSRWAHNVLAEAVEYAKHHASRSLEVFEQDSGPDETAAVFYKSLWPSLKGRGWKEEINGELIAYVHDSTKVRFSFFPTRFATRAVWSIHCI